MSKSSIDLYVEKRLRMWGTWVEKCITSGLGFPSSSAFTKINIHNIQKSSTSLINHPDEEAEEIDRAIVSLNQYKPILAKVIILRYTEGKGLRDKLKKINLQYETYKKYLQIAKSWISGILIHSLDSKTF